MVALGVSFGVEVGVANGAALEVVLGVAVRGGVGVVVGVAVEVEIGVEDCRVGAAAMTSWCAYSGGDRGRSMLLEATCWCCGMTVRQEARDDGELARLRSELRQARARLGGLVNVPGSAEFYRAMSSEWHRLSRKLARELETAQRENARLEEENRGLRQLVALPESARIAPTYVDATGLVRIPVRVRARLGILNGGGVQFVEDERPWIRLMTDQTFFDETGLGCEEDA